MKRTSLYLLTVIFVALTFFVKADNATHSDCRLDAKFIFKPSVCSGNFVDASIAGKGTKITSWHWRFGDGDTSNIQNPTHAYKYSGKYKVSLTVTSVNSKGKVCKDRTDREVSVRGCAADSLRCRLNANYRYVRDTNNCDITFYDSSKAAPSTTILSRSWSFGDGTTSTVQNPVHVYKYSGRYYATLTIVGVNAAGDTCRDRASREITLKGCVADSLRCRIAAKFKYAKDTTNTCNLTFTDSSKTATGTTIVRWHWNFGDGDTSNVKNPTHKYNYSGHYKVCLTIVAKNAAGEICRDRECREITLKGCAGDTMRCRLAAKFDATKDSTCNVTFQDLSKTANSSTKILSWNWKFGDGTTSTVQNPSHAYKYSGRYTVCLSIVGVNTLGDTCRDRECRDITLKSCPSDSSRCRLYAKFGYEADSTSVEFGDSSKLGSTTTITDWYWSFGDGGKDSIENPTHVYAKAGHYTVCLTVVGVNAAGETCKDRTCRTVKIRAHRGIEDDEALNVSTLQLYPNPAKDVVNISFEMAKEGQANVTVSDLQGRTLFVVKEGYFGKGTQNLNWNVGVPSGWYLVTVKTDAAIEHKPLFIQK